jgi:hypothetical protein
MSGGLRGRRQCSWGQLERRVRAERSSLLLIQANRRPAKPPEPASAVRDGVLGYKAADHAVCATALVPRP